MLRDGLVHQQLARFHCNSSFARGCAQKGTERRDFSMKRTRWGQPSPKDLRSCRFLKFRRKCFDQSANCVPQNLSSQKCGPRNLVDMNAMNVTLLYYRSNYVPLSTQSAHIHNFRRAKLR
ncbi:unnamed protein product [Ectocarpus fasciculatus]